MAITSELPIEIDASAMDMANAMFGAGISVLDASYQGAEHASGIYSQGDSVAPGFTPSDSGVILSTGRATDITNSSGDANISAGTSTSNLTLGDADLSAISGRSRWAGWGSARGGLKDRMRPCVSRRARWGITWRWTCRQITG
ncbi:choice-of-anchor L domain-containing protein [Roseovarius nitratireducens]|uniref:choice-of-anchor L domain-containing protein n=1 Tax=Roseovarius nitratireducens TaxID=2044597 RepID=UPI001F0BB3EF|nr:choice-of-anchor L domain-containing protein [Roseovarius nitratireducens]